MHILKIGMQTVSTNTGVAIVLVAALIVAGAVFYLFNEQGNINLSSAVRHFGEIWKDVLGRYVICRGATCTINQTFWEAAVGAKGFYFSLSSNVFTSVDTEDEAVAPGSTVCLNTNSDGEVIGFGERFYDSPPIVFNTNRTVIGDISSLVRLNAENDRDMNLSRENISAFRIESTWSDVWKTYAGSQLTDAARCATKQDSFEATCTIDPSIQASDVRFELRRGVEPFRVTGTTFPVYETTLEKCLENNREKGTNIRCEEVGTATMIVSAVVSINPNLPVTNCGVPVPQPSPSPTSSPTPTPSPIVTAPPEVTPTFSPAPSPTQIRPSSTPSPIFQGH